MVVHSPIGAMVIHQYNRMRPGLNWRNSPACLKKLAKTPMQFTPVQDHTEPDGCALRNVVSISQSSIAYNAPFLVTCSMARSLDKFERKVVQPAAQKAFQQPVVRIHHFGTYNCRPMRGSRRLLSEHAYANAIDIRAFELQDGTMISVKDHWKDAGEKSEFLHTIARRGCSVFQTVLTPNYNQLHHDHFHFDNGVFSRCGY